MGWPMRAESGLGQDQGGPESMLQGIQILLQCHEKQLECYKGGSGKVLFFGKTTMAVG